MNVPVTKADLASHILQMCLLMWQDRFNLHKKGITPVNMCLLHMALEAIECICTQEKPSAQSNKKASNKRKKGTKRPGTESRARVLTKVPCSLQEALQPLQEAWGAYTMHNTKDCHNYEKDGSEKDDFHAAKNGRKRPNPAKKFFMQLSKKLEKLEKAIQK
jgi:hypothetical protein